MKGLVHPVTLVTCADCDACEHQPFLMVADVWWEMEDHMGKSFNPREYKVSGKKSLSILFCKIPYSCKRWQIRLFYLFSHNWLTVFLWGAGPGRRAASFSPGCSTLGAGSFGRGILYIPWVESHSPRRRSVRATPPQSFVWHKISHSCTHHVFFLGKPNEVHQTV